MEDILAFTWSRASSCPSGTQLRLGQLPVLPCWFWVWWLVQAQLSEPWSCQAGPQHLPEFPSSSWEQHLCSSHHTLSRTRCHRTTVGVRLLSSLCGLAVAKCPAWHLPGHSQQHLAVGPAQRSPPCPQSRAPVPAGMLCVPGCAWRSWRWEQGREDAQPVGYEAFSLVSSSALRAVDVQPSLDPSSAQPCHALGTAEPGSLPAMPYLDHLSNHFIPGCSGSVVSSDLLAEAVDLGWHMGFVVVALPLQDVTGFRRPSSSSSL